jgi:hypothetical protein
MVFMDLGDFFRASRWTLYAMAAACLGGRPARISVAMFFPMARLLVLFINGMIVSLYRFI